MVITMGFYTLSHGKFHDGGYSDILHRINSMISWDAVLQIVSNHNHMVITLFYYPDWVV